MQTTGRAPVVAAGAAGGLLAALALNAVRAHPDISQASVTLQEDLADLTGRSALDEVLEDIQDLDAALTHALELLESAREKGFHYQHDLEEIAHRALTTWEAMRVDVETAVRQEAQAFQNRLHVLQRPVRNLNARIHDPDAATSLLQSTQSQVGGLLGELDQVEGRLRSRFQDVQAAASTLTTRLNEIHRALNHLDEASFGVEAGEDLVMAVAARWDLAGEDDPEGVLFLTNRRLLFERKEKEATKKVLFITVASELVQELVLDQPLDSLEGVKAANKGLFGHQDFLEISFAGAGPGTVEFHLSGQESGEWARLIEAARTGQIEEDRASGSGLSYADLIGPLTQASLVALQSEVNELQDEMMLKAVRAELEGLENRVRGLERQLGELRSRGYAIESNLEPDIAILVSQWERVKTNAQSILEQQAGLLGTAMQALQQSMVSLMGKAGDLESARPDYMSVKSALASAEAQAEAAEETVMAQFEAYADEVDLLAAHLAWVAWMLDALETASFKLMATESGVAATESAWTPPNAPEPLNGILFLTDQRLLWEDRVGQFEVHVQVPLKQIEELSHREVNGAAERLVFSFAAGVPLRGAEFLLAQPVGEAWLKMVGRARSGDYVQDRALEIDPGELERVRKAPTQCPNCGAAFTAPILRGQVEVVCEYCGVSARL